MLITLTMLIKLQRKFEVKNPVKMGENEFNKLEVRPKPKPIIENGNENEQLTNVKPSKAYEDVRVQGNVVRMKWSNDIN